MGGEHVQVWRFWQLPTTLNGKCVYLGHLHATWQAVDPLQLAVVCGITKCNHNQYYYYYNYYYYYYYYRLLLPPLLLLLVVMYGFVFGRGMPNVKIWYDYMWLQVLLSNSWGGLLVYATMLIIMHICP